MRALPGRASRAGSDAAPATVTRTSAHLDQRRRLLRAVADVVAERGYSDATVEMIVKRAHVSYKTFYKHYRSKQECFEDLFEVAYQSTEQRIADSISDSDLSWPEEVVTVLRTLIDAVVSEPAAARAVIVDAPSVGGELTSRFEGATRALAPLLRAGRAHSPQGAALPETIEDTLAGAVFWSAYERLIVGEVETLNDYLPVLTEMILRPYLGSAEAARIARAGAAAPEPAVA